MPELHTNFLLYPPMTGGARNDTNDRNNMTIFVATKGRAPELQGGRGNNNVARQHNISNPIQLMPLPDEDEIFNE